MSSVYWSTTVHGIVLQPNALLALLKYAEMYKAVGIAEHGTPANWKFVLIVSAAKKESATTGKVGRSWYIIAQES